jgi:hypothetical protein
MYQGLLIPGHDLMIKFAGNSEKKQAATGHAFGQVNALGVRVDPKLQFTSRSDDRRKPALGRNAGQQQLGIEFPNLIFHRY